MQGTSILSLGSNFPRSSPGVWKEPFVANLPGGNTFHADNATVWCWSDEDVEEIYSEARARGEAAAALRERENDSVPAWVLPALITLGAPNCITVSASRNLLIVRDTQKAVLNNHFSVYAGTTDHNPC